MGRVATKGFRPKLLSTESQKEHCDQDESMGMGAATVHRQNFFGGGGEVTALILR